MEVTRADVSEIKIVDTDLVLTLKDGRKLYVSDGAIQSMMDPEFAVEFADGSALGGQELLQSAGQADVNRIVTTTTGGGGEAVVTEAAPTVVASAPPPAPAPAKSGGLKSWLAIGTPLVGGLLGGVMGGGGGSAAAGATGGTGGNTATGTKTGTPVIAVVTSDDKISAAEKSGGVTIGGTAEANATVTVIWGSVTKTATASASGAWTVSYAGAELPSDGLTTLSATAKTSTGQQSDPATRNIQVDTTAPNIPTIAIIAGDNVVGPNEKTAGVTIVGNAEPGSAVAVSWGGVTKSIMADGVGNWSVNFGAGEVPAAGSYTVTATATDALGNTSGIGNRAISVSPSVTVEGTITAGPVITGNGLVVDIYTGSGALVASGVVVAADGSFRAANLALSPGEIIVVRVEDKSTSPDYLDEASNTPKDLNAAMFAAAVVDGASLTVNVNPLTTIAAVKAGLALDGSGTLTSGVAVTNALEATARGLGLAGVDLLKVKPVPTNTDPYNPVDGVSDAEKIGAVLAALSGADQANGGDSQATLVALTGALTVTGTSGTLSDAGAQLIVAGANMASKFAPGSLTTVVSDTLSTASGGGQISLASVTPDNIVTAAEVAGLRFSGTLPTGATAVTLQVGSATFSPTIGDAGWSYDLRPGDLALIGEDGAKVAKVTATLVDTTTVSASRAFVLSATRPTAPTIAPIAADNVVNAAERTAGVTINGTAPLGTSVEVTVGSVKKTAIAGANATWAVNLAALELPTSGTLNVKATATDSVGNVSNETVQPLTFSTATPAAPVISVIAGDDQIGPVEKAGGVVVSGTAVAGGKVALTFGATTRVVQVDAAGAWSTNFTSSQIPEDNDYVIQAVATDPAGNMSTATSRPVRVDATAPAPPVIANVTNDNLISQAERVVGVTVRGTSEANANIDVTWGGVTRPAKANASGAWSAFFASNQVPNDGTTTVSAVATDASGNVSQPGTKQVTVDSSTPAPTITSIGSGSVINANERANGVVVRGTAEVGATVTVNFGAVSQKVIADQAGLWQTTFSGTDIPNATSTTVTAQATDAAGNVSVTTPRTAAIDIVIPDKPTINPVSNDDLVGTADFVTPLRISGTAEPNADVSVTWGQVTKPAKADSLGAWSVTFSNSEKPIDGSIELIVRAIDAAGNVSEAARRMVTVDYDDAAPVIADVTGNNLIGRDERNAGVDVTGTARAGSTITVTWNGFTKTATADASGAWTVNYTTAQIPTSGTTNITARALTPAGNTSSTVTRPVTVDLVASPPTIAAVSVDDLVGSQDIAAGINVTGTAEPGSDIVVTWGAATVNAKADNSGAWLAVFDGTNLPADGASTITAQAVDPAGNTSTVTPRPVTIDRVKPGQPTIDMVAGNDIVSAAERTAGVVVSGTAEAGATVTVRWDGGSSRDVVADASGLWTTTFQSAAIQTQGSVNVTAFQSDRAGNAGDPASRLVTVDTVPPAPPTIADITGDKIVNTAERLAGVAVTGTALPNAPVSVTWGSVTKPATADASGAWSVTFVNSEIPGDGTYIVTAVQSDPAGNTSGNATQSVTVDTGSAAGATVAVVSGDGLIGNSERQAGVTVTGTAPANGRVDVNWNGVTRTVFARADGTWDALFTTNEIPTSGTSTITATPFTAAGNPGTSGTRSVTVDTAPPAAPVIATVAGNDILNAAEKSAVGGVVVSGTGEPGGKVIVSWGATTLPEADIDTSGNWSVTFTSAQIPADGSTSITATQKDPAGNPSTTAATRSVTIDTVAPAAPTFAGTAIAGDNIVNLAEKTNGSGITISGAGAEAGATVSVNWGSSSRTTTANAGGAWSVTFSSTEVPSDGTPAITASQRDAAGNISPLRTRTPVVTIDTTGPNAPVIATVSAGAIVSNSEKNAGVTISGTTESGSSVAVTWGGVTKPATVTGTNWSVTFSNTEIPGDGPSSITATATDAAGNVGTTSAPTAVTVDTTPPARPVISTVAGNDVVNNAEKTAGVVVSGTAEANATVAVTWGGKTQVASTNASGAWSTTFAGADIPTDTNASVISAAATDVASNTGAAETRTVVIDTTPPPLPVIMGMSNGYSGAAFTTDRSTVRLSGTGEAGGKIVVTVGGASVEANIDARGYWISPEITIPAAAGSVTVSVQQQDAQGNLNPTAVSQIITRAAGLTTSLNSQTYGPSSGFAIWGEKSNDFLGTADAGDFNADGYVDLIVGAYGNDETANSSGRAYVLFGSANGAFGSTSVAGAAGRRVVNLAQALTTSQGFYINSESGAADLGSSVSAAGDINRDGIMDFVVAASAFDTAASNTGKSYVLFGQSGTPASTVLSLTSLTASAGFSFQGINQGDQVGSSVSEVGDVNGDGRTDLLIGSINGDRGGSNAGEAYIIYGRADGAFGNWTPQTLTTDRGFAIVGDTNSDNLGRSVAGGGDFNGDNLADILLGSPGANVPADAGEAYLIFGATTRAAVLDAGALASTDGLVIKGIGTGDETGISVTFANVNGDAFADLVIGAHKADLNGTDSGAVYVIFGRAGTPPGTLVGGRRVLDLTNLAPSDGFVITGEAAGDLLGASVASAGDVNGDGIGDLLIGAPGADNGSFADAGKAYILLGKSDGTWGTLVSGRQTFSFTGLSSADGVVLTSTVGGDGIGSQVSAGGDLNGDELADVLIGAEKANVGGRTDAGAVYALFGQATWGGLTLTGDSNANFLSGSDGNDSISGEGGADALFGHAGNDTFIVTATNFARIDGGAGTDTLVLNGSGMSLNLTTLASESLTGIERIDIKGFGTTGNTLTITRDTLLALSDTSDTLVVNADANDTVNASGFTTSGATQTINGVTYNVYTNGGATLLVQAGGSVVTPPDALGAASLVLDPYGHGQMVL